MFTDLIDRLALRLSCCAKELKEDKTTSITSRCFSPVNFERGTVKLSLMDANLISVGLGCKFLNQ